MTRLWIKLWISGFALAASVALGIFPCRSRHQGRIGTPDSAQSGGVRPGTAAAMDGA